MSSSANLTASITRNFLSGSVKHLLVDGQWVAAQSGETFDVIDPTTEAVIASVALADAADVDRAVQAAQRAFESSSWSRISPHQRARYLLRIADLMDANTQELAALLSHEMGAVLRETLLMPPMLADVFRYYAGWTTKIGGRTNPSDSAVFNYTLREPLGVVGAIISWNGPLLSAVWKIAPALACGNTVVLKPAEVAPLAVLRLGEIMMEAGLPSGVVNMVPGLGKGAGEALINHPLVAKLAFTGSTEVGRHIMRTAAGSMKKVSLELGGKSPTIVFSDADIDKAVAMSTYGFVGNTGQMCVAGSRIFVQEAIYDKFAEKMVAAARAMKTGSPFDENTDIGPLSSQGQLSRVVRYLNQGVAAGARLLTGGTRKEGTGYFVEPAVFTDVNTDMTIVREEIFGPVAAIARFSDENDAILQGNNTEFGLSATVWTRDAGRAHRVARAIKAGTIWVNTMFNLDPSSPFGGYKSSGVGRELGPDSIDAHTQIKSVYLGL